MILQVLHCPHCHGTDIVRHGRTRQGKQRYRCREKRYAGRTFLLEYKQHLANLRRKDLLPRLRNELSVCKHGRLFCLALCGCCL
jgi:transposase-like protein